MPRDQGFTRPKVLLLLPMRNMAFQVVKRLVALAQKETRADSVQVGLAGIWLESRCSCPPSPRPAPPSFAAASGLHEPQVGTAQNCLD